MGSQGTRAAAWPPSRQSGVLDYLFVVPSASVHRIQEAQTTVYDVLWDLTQRRCTESPGPMPVRRLIRVEGIVQGVGFRPFVHRTAIGLGLVGHVANDERGVVIEVQGESDRIADLVTAVREHPAATVQ